REETLVNEWGEPFAMVTQALTEPERVEWVTELVELHNGLGLRVLAQADVGPQLAATVLAAADDRRERWMSYEWLSRTESSEDLISIVQSLVRAEGESTSFADVARLDDLLREIGEGSSNEEATKIARQRDKLVELAFQRAKNRWQRNHPAEETQTATASLERNFGRAIKAAFARCPVVGGPCFLEVAPGSFTMGSSPRDDMREEDEGPVHGVEISDSFWIARTAVTCGQYDLLAVRPDFSTDLSNDHPVVGVTWYECAFFCRVASRAYGEALNAESPVEIRLPREHEWEFAVRGRGRFQFDRPAPGGSEKGWLARYSIGDTEADLERIAHFGGVPLQPVATLEPLLLNPGDPYGLYDMLGNQWE
ncbi:MAG: formylglycine-generating enzyme family protein, partial [Planctomycetota bacterium]